MGVGLTIILSPVHVYTMLQYSRMFVSLFVCLYSCIRICMLATPFARVAFCFKFVTAWPEQVQIISMNYVHVLFRICMFFFLFIYLYALACLCLSRPQQQQRSYESTFSILSILPKIPVIGRLFSSSASVSHRTEGKEKEEQQSESTQHA